MRNSPKLERDRPPDAYLELYISLKIKRNRYHGNMISILLIFSIIIDIAILSKMHSYQEFEILMSLTSKKLKEHIILALSVCPVQSSPSSLLQSSAVRELRLTLGQKP